ncbi:MAG: dienelactone hydrolase family protein [candidate division Zixibacteria bacterium]|nr:dienelactone hydrolase family protein [candidate division Zixibacteria bacterium]
MSKSYNRREFVRQGVRGLAGWMNVLRNADTPVPKVEAGDIRLMSAMANYPGSDGRIPAFIARPEAAGVYPSVIVVHGASGPTDTVRNAALRLARKGFVAIAPSLFAAKEAMAPHDDATTPADVVPDTRILADLDATIEHLDVLTFADARRIGVVGFSEGGTHAFLFAAHTPRIRAAAVFCGHISSDRTPHAPDTPVDAVPRLHCPILGLFGDTDPLVPITDVHALRDAMIAHKKPFEIKIYPGAAPGFFDDALPAYRSDMTEDAWNRMLTFFWKHLQGAAP